MLNGEKAVSYASPHYALLTAGKPEKVTLPPISSYVGLTEKNLNSLNSLNSNSLNLLNTLNSNTWLSKASSASSLPLLTSLLTSLLALELPLLLPRIAAHDLYKMSHDTRTASMGSSAAAPAVTASSAVAVAATLSAAHSAAPQSISTPHVAAPPASLAANLSANDSPKKRRQRLGPSCDNCRARKVKCNAEVLMLSRHFGPSHRNLTHNQVDQNDDSYIEEFASLLPEQQLAVMAGSLVGAGDYTLVLSKGKLIKFKACLSCAAKGLGCCFSKGFTKEDIVYSKRSGPEAVPVMVERKVAPVKVVKKRTMELSGSSRKSSCTACRKRKVKCVVHTGLNRCIGCMKKDSPCSFEG